MFKAFINIFRVPELRNKVLFTLFMLLIYRIGYAVPLPGVDQKAIADLSKNDDSAVGRLASYVSLFSGGSLQQSTIFGLGIMPYISASIIFQLLGTVVPSLEKLQKEGGTGQRKIQEWSRYTTVPLCLMQAVIWLNIMKAGIDGSPLVLPIFMHKFFISFWLIGVISLTAGSVFLMWLGEQIDEYGLGNGVSLVILAGIVARMPSAVVSLVQGATANTQGPNGITPGKIVFLAACFMFVVAGSIVITQAQRRIPVQQAKHTRGRRVYGGQKQYLPLRVNHGGVMPIIFAQSLMLFPGMFLDKLAKNWSGSAGGFHEFSVWLDGQFSLGRANGGFLYLMTEVVMIYFFAYFWTTVQFQPKEMANQLRDYGSFVPGIRPGKRTSDYLEKVVMRITYVGAAFLCIVAVVPSAVTSWLDIPYNITAFLGGTGLLIVVSVALDMIQRIEANLVMRNYGTFLGGDDRGGKGKRIKGRQY